MAKKLSPFEQAYANARAEGLLKFDFNGQQYHTRRADETDKDWYGNMRKAASARLDKEMAQASKKTEIKPLKPQEDLEEEELTSWRSGSRAGGKVRYAK
jgi:hypothetical protein